MEETLTVIYLAAGKAVINLEGYEITYQDKFIKRDIPGCMLDMADIIKDFTGFYYEIGRHSYFTNRAFNGTNIKQTTQFKSNGVYIGKPGERQGGKNVNDVIAYWLESL